MRSRTIIVVHIEVVSDNTVQPLSVFAVHAHMIPISSFESFETYCHKYPMLTAEEEHELAVQYRTHQNLAAAERLVMSHMRLVLAAARKYRSSGVPMPDLVQQGAVGLMTAVQKFDPEYDLRLTTFAIYRINEAITDYVVRNVGIAKIATTKSQRKLFFNLRSLKSGRPLTPQLAAEISSELDVPLEEVYRMNDRLSQQDLCLDVPIGHSGETWADVLVADTASPEEELIAKQHYEQAHVALPACIAQLDSRSRVVVEKRLLADTPATLKDLASEFGVSIERIRQIENKAIATLRTMMH